MKRIIALVLLLSTLLTMTACDAETMKLLTDSIGALTKIASKGNEYEYGDCTLVVRDTANLISDSEETAIVSKLAPYCSRIKCDVLIMASNEIGLSSVSPGASYANAYLPKGTEDWIAFSFDAARNCYYIWYDGDIVFNALPDSKLDKALSLAAGPLNDDKYAEALEVMAEYCLKEIANSK